MVMFVGAAVSTAPMAPQADESFDFRHSHKPDGRRLFERETFGGNGRTCRTCHSDETGTVSPEDARRRFRRDRHDPLFVHDGSDDGQGKGVSRMLKDATIRISVPLTSNVRLAADPAATSMVVARGIPTTINTPALDPVLMLDGRQPDLRSQALGAIVDHAQATRTPTSAELDALVTFERSPEFFSSLKLLFFSKGGPAPGLPSGYTPAQKRGRRFFEDVVDFADAKHGLCAACHAGPMLNETNLFSQIAFGIPVGTRFQDILVSELNAAGNPVHEFVFNQGQPNERHVFSPDLGRAAFFFVFLRAGGCAVFLFVFARGRDGLPFGLAFAARTSESSYASRSQSVTGAST
jgi:cytochrome c peroxidase